MPFLPNQRPSAPWSNGNWWGQFDAVADLPNTAGADFQVNDLQAGDIAWVAAANQLYYCTDPTIGAAAWAAIGGGGGSATDHFAPRIIVGNVLSGDPATPQVAPFRYIPDPGDGSGIALALSEAAASEGDVFVRSGAYTLPLGTATLDVPAGVTLRGAGWGETIITGAPDQRAVFRVGQLATLADLRIIMPLPASGATGDLVVELTGSSAGSATAVNVYVDASSGLQDPINESLIGGIGTLAGAPGAVGARALDCVVLGGVYSFVDPASAKQFACYSFPDADQAVIRGQGLFGDYLLRLTDSASRCIVDLQGENYRTAIISGTWHQLRLTGITFALSFVGDPTPYAVQGVSMQRCDMTIVVQGSDIDPSVQALVLDENSIGNRIALTCETYGTGATVDGSKNVLSGISVDAGLGSATDGIVFTAASSDNVLIGGVLDAVTPITDAGTTNEIAHTV
jgi:hypothetical protein